MKFAYIIEYTDSKGDRKNVTVKLPNDLGQVEVGRSRISEEEFVKGWLKNVTTDVLKETGLAIISVSAATSP